MGLWQLRRFALGGFILVACNSAVTPSFDANPSSETSIGLSLTKPACMVTATIDPLLLPYTVTDQGQLTVEIYFPDGTTTTILRRYVNAGESGTIIIPPNSLVQGSNTIAIWVYAENKISAVARLVFDAQTPKDPKASAVDQDGDCYSPRTNDCDDLDAAINPGVQEICTNGIDDNCNGLVDYADPECAGKCVDADGDGYPSANCGGTDCNDNDPTIHPGAVEVCDGIDNNCNGQIDEDNDNDHDGFVNCGPGGFANVVAQVSGAPCPPGFATCVDCDDNDPTTYPGAFEPCDDKVHSCSAALAAAKFQDIDGDGYFNCEDPDSDNDGICDPNAEKVMTITACAVANEPDGICCGPGPNNLPDNCPFARNYAQTDADGDGIGDACDPCTDADGDGFGRSGSYLRNADLSPIGAAINHPPGDPASDPNTFAQSGCVGNSTSSALGTTPDCDDVPGAGGGALCFPGNSEVCDGLDNNCNGETDEDFDQDSDGYTTCGSHDQNGYHAPPLAALVDCDDQAATIHPNAVEVCNGADDNCNGLFDETFDHDGDGYTTCGLIRVDGSACPNGASTCVDCDDVSAPSGCGAACNPGIVGDICDGFDNNCNGTTDEYSDHDGDGYTTCGSRAGLGSATYNHPPLAAQIDCDDQNAKVHPGQVEICNNIDDNCILGIDELCDQDGDGYCDATRMTASGPLAICPHTNVPALVTGYGDDCDDHDPTINPGVANDTFCDGVDHNCNGLINEGYDQDGDGFITCPPVPAVVVTWTTHPGVGCPSGPSGMHGFVDQNGQVECQDCNDQDPNIYPGAPEICFNGQNDNCNQAILDENDSACCSSVEPVYMVNAATGASMATDSFSEYPVFEILPDITGNLPTIPPANSAMSGWEVEDMSGECTTPRAYSGAFTWRSRVTTLADISDLPLGAPAFGTYGNDGDSSFWDCVLNSVDSGPRSQTNCFYSTGLISPAVNLPSAESLAAKDRVIVEYHRFAAHETNTLAPGLNTPGTNLCDRSTNYSADGLPSATGIYGDQSHTRCDQCYDGEYLSVGSWGIAPSGECFMDYNVPTANAAGPPAGLATCPLGAVAKDINQWAWVYGDLTELIRSPPAWVSLASGQLRFMWRLDTFDAAYTPQVTSDDPSGPDDGLYINNVTFFVCRAPLP